MDDPDGPSDAERILVTGGFVGVALVLLLQGQGTAMAAERALGIIAGLLVALLLWWWMRHRERATRGRGLCAPLAGFAKAKTPIAWGPSWRRSRLS